MDERTDKNAAGFFGDIRNVSGGTVGAKNLIISDASIYADEEGLMELRAGILAGYALANPGQQIVFENITVSGQVVIAVCIAAVFVSFAFVVKLTQPIEYRR